MNDTQLKQISRYIEKARHDVLSNGSDDTGALLFMGETQDPIPRTLIIDPTLNAIDVRIWMLLRISIANPSLPGKLPTQKELSDLIQCSEMTIWSSMQILRLNRWLTLCERVYDQKQMNRGNIYAIHTEPMTIADTLSLDTSYLDFIDQSLNTKTKRIKNNAMAAHIAFYKQVHNNESSFNRTQLQQHDARFEALQSHHNTENPQIITDNEQNYYAHNLSQMEKQDNYEEYYKNEAYLLEDCREIATDPNNWGRENLPTTKIGVGEKSTDPNNWGRRETAQQSHSSPTPIFGVGKSGSSSIFKRLSNTTTTTKDQAFELKSFDRFKTFIRSNEIPIIERILHSIPESDRQDVLDQVLGRLTHFKRTGQGEIYNLVGFLQKIKARVHSGEFQVDSHGLKIRQVRETEERMENVSKQTPEPKSKSVEKNPISEEQQKQRMDALTALKDKMRM